MPQIGWFEILIIVAIAIIVIGPKDFPFVLKKIGSWIGTIKRYIQNIQQEVSELDKSVEIKTDEVKTEKKENDQK
tara:strand:+ start:169 stop:393 length:225 start_codon:yes stop_codon:yes gene_type:complete